VFGSVIALGGLGAGMGALMTGWCLLPVWLARLRRWARAGRVLRPGDPHLYAPEWPWLGWCWCGKPKDAAVHASRIGGPR
jgi:hypothetical protein